MKKILHILLILLFLPIICFSQNVRTTSAKMFKDTGIKKDGYGTSYHTFDIYYGSVSETGVFTIESTTKRYEAKPGSNEAQFMRSASGFNAWCVVASYSLPSIGRPESKKIYNEDNSTWYGMVTVVRIVQPKN